MQFSFKSNKPLTVRLLHYFLWLLTMAKVIPHMEQPDINANWYFFYESVHYSSVVAAIITFTDTVFPIIDFL